MGAPPPLWMPPPDGGGGGFDAASRGASHSRRNVVATYLAVRFAGQGAAPDIEGATGSRSEHREDAKVT
jgi:hypothetical protein